MKLIRAIFIGALFLLTANAKSSDCQGITRFEDKLKDSPVISIEFLQITRSDIFQTQDTIRGTIKTGGQGRFRIETPSQVMVSNGIVEWDYSPENEQVIVDTLDRQSDIDPLTIIYDPLRIYSCQNQEENQGGIIFSMVALDSTLSPAKLDITVAGNDFTPLKMEYVDENGSEIKIIILKFRQADTISDSSFEFSAPDGIEVIYMP